jgi:glyoxylase-like metal-dependent hydrolase (beta-lactamase superfamily II)/rhodanese-related sulfurtransferase
VIFRQLINDDLGCASYLVGDECAGVAAVVDPALDVDPVLQLADYLDLRIAHVLETHTHADHVSGHGRLVAATGATIHVHASAGPDYAHEPIEDGWRLELGRLAIVALHTPGHRPEHTAFALVDGARGEEPWAVLTGDSLFVNDVARPDLAVEPAEGARGVFRSLHETLLPLPDACEVWPGHLGGSMCGGAGMDRKPSSTIGYERAHNPLLAIEDEARFVETALAGLGPQPPNFTAIVALNRGPLRADETEPPSLFPAELEAHVRDGALLVDVRASAPFDAAHIAGAVSVPVGRSGFGTKLAWIASGGRDVVLVGDGARDTRRAALLAGTVGVRALRGWLEGGMERWRGEDRPCLRIERLPAGELPGRLAQDPRLQVLDVRDARERAAGSIPGSVHRPWHDVDGVPDGLDAERPVAVVCAGGARAGVAASLLQPHVAADVLHVVDGGVTTWAALGHRLEPAETG